LGRFIDDQQTQLPKGVVFIFELFMDGYSAKTCILTDESDVARGIPMPKEALAGAAHDLVFGLINHIFWLNLLIT